MGSYHFKLRCVARCLVRYDLASTAEVWRWRIKRLNLVGSDVVEIDSTLDKAPCVAERNEGHRTFARDGSAFVQTANSHANPDIRRRKRVVHGSNRAPRDSSARQATDGERCHTDAKRARRQRGCRVATPNGERPAPIGGSPRRQAEPRFTS